MLYWDVFYNSFKGTIDWVINSILMKVPWYENYFWGLIIISIVVWILEIAIPWRKHQSIIRKDFWMDCFYMFFNFFIFSILISGFYSMTEQLFSSIGYGISSIAIIDLSSLSRWAQLLIFFILLDFVQWITHVLLHRIDFLWQFHKVHHSVKEMGFAAHLRYHWMENVLYKPLKTLAVMLMGGFEPAAAFLIHFLSISIGHLNHANIKITWGPLKYVFNNSVMHLWHHAKNLPSQRRYGVNFGLSLSLWDYLFRTSYIPNTDGEIPIGFEGDEEFPKTFKNQFIFGFKRIKTK
ncbi:MAG: sterol desaturase family protein [Cyclobacteriaceae bacterium]